MEYVDGLAAMRCEGELARVPVALAIAPASEADVGAWVRRWAWEVAPAPVSNERTATEPPRERRPSK